MALPTKNEFIAYEKVRQDGSFNMFDPMAIKVSGLDKETYLNVMKHYSELNETYPEVREGTYEKLEIEVKINWK